VVAETDDQVANQENTMSNTQRCRALMVAVVALGVAVAMPQAHAFNPQPDPPAKQKAFTYQKNLKTSKASARAKTTASGAPCSPGASCGAIDSYKGTKK
jgi:hypothetical protein